MVRFVAENYEFRAQSFPPFQGSKGSIIRLKIIDFMTYQDVEMTAGPNVNLVVGPNGTGKSTIVCAICLVLAGKPKILGRAHALKEYIRHGATTATIEIELHNPESPVNGVSKNYIIKRVIQETGTGASSDWFLNNQKVQQNTIEKLMESLNIQLDNLCQFLPQDRVQDFAKMDSIQLLKSTEQSVDNNDDYKLAKKHERLILMFENIKQLEAKLKKSEECLRIETQLNTRVENEVRAFNDREELKRNIHDLEGKKSWILYTKAVSVFNDLNEEKKKVDTVKAREEKKILPMKKEIEVLNAKLDDYRSTMHTTRNKSHSMIASLRRQYRDQVDHTETEVHRYKVEFDTSVKNERDRVRRMKDFEERLLGLKKEFESLKQKGDCDTGELRRELLELDELQTKCSNRIYELAGLNDSQESEIRAAKSKIKLMETELRAMGEFRSSRMRFLERRNPDVAKAVQYFADPANKECFAGVIHEPLILHIYVNDLTYGRVAERHIPNTDLTAFFCENKEDVKKMIQVSLDHNWRVSCIHHENVVNFKRPPANWSNLDLETYGFQKNLINLIEAPEYYMSYVCKSARPQDILIGTNQTDDMSQEIIDYLPLKCFYTAKYCYTIRTSFYTGQKNSTISYLYDAQIFTDQINAAESDRLRESLEHLTNDIKVLQNNISARQPEINKFTAEREEVERRKKAINDRIENRNKTLNKIETCEEMIRSNAAGAKDIDLLREAWRKKTFEERISQLQTAEHCTRGISKIGENWCDMLVLKRQTSVLQSRVITKKNQHEEAKANFGTYTTKLKALEADIKTAADNAMKLKNASVEKTGVSEPPVDTGELEEQYIEAEINRFIAQLNFLPETDDKIVHDYQTRKKKIAEMAESKLETETTLAQMKTELQEEKSSWLEPLSQLIFKININFGYFFSAMKCVGEISLSTPDDENDFAKYGVKIMVKFRSNEPLVELTGWKQSGGERAITTALYILALQELTKVPFRVIDEINQGMDARNETRFFQLLCSLAQGHDTPQYFLLTPKMLPPVDYPTNVDFHIIFNGPFVNVGWKDAIDTSQAEEENRANMGDEEEEEEEEEEEVEEGAD